jgi:hypothetical protein
MAKQCTLLATGGEAGLVQAAIPDRILKMEGFIKELNRLNLN